MNTKLFLDQEPEEFDQSPETGWRKLDDSGHTLEAAQVIEAYLAHHARKFTKQPPAGNVVQFMHFHAGQLYASLGKEHYPAALMHFEQSERPNREGWNEYVKATTSFLKGDATGLMRSVDALKALEDRIGLAFVTTDIAEQLLTSLRSGETSYKVAFNNGQTELPALRHVDLVVSSLETSLAFYREVLRPLGWKQEGTIAGERGERLVYLAGPGGFKDGAIGLRQRQSHDRSQPYDRYDLGVHHVAFNAPSRRDVDRCADWLRRHGHTIESGPAEFYNNHYYAVFFYDPDGIKLEVICGW